MMSCNRILMKSNEKIEQQFTAVLHAIVSKFNIDGLYPMIFTKWQVVLLVMHLNNSPYTYVKYVIVILAEFTLIAHISCVLIQNVLQI